MKKKLIIDCVFLFLIGCITSLSLPPYNYFFVNFFTFTSIFIFLIKKAKIHKKKNLFFFYGWIFGFGFFMTNLYWISFSLTFDENFKFLIPLTLILLPALLSIFFGLIFLFFIIFKPKKLITSFLIFSLLFGILEFLRGSILTGFPWNLIAYSFLDQLKILSIISIIGSYGFNLLCISLFTSPALIILRDSKKDLIVCFIFLISFILFYIHGFYYEKKFISLEKKFFDYKIRSISSNISLDRFYVNVDSRLILEELIKISKPVSEEKTIFVWPEGILPTFSQDQNSDLSKIIEDNFSRNHLLIIGSNTEITDKGYKKFFNSLSVYDNKLNLLSSYDKIKLVPFGEFLPFEKVLKRLGLKSLTNNYQSFSRGEERKIINIEKKNFSLKILPLICYEIIYSGKLFDKADFDFIVNISEDGWFGRSIGPKQHFSHSILRAIESGKYIIRSSNNGIASIINPLGVVEQIIDFGQSGYLDLNKINKIQPTIFSKFKNKIFGLLILLYILLIFSFNKIENE